LLVESQTKELIKKKRELTKYNMNLQEMVDEKTRTVIELQNAILGTMSDLVESRDGITGGHIERTQRYLRILIEAIWSSGSFKDEVSDWDVELLLQSAQLHDVGKISIDDSILRKRGKLTEEEFTEIKKHTIIGMKIIDGIKTKTTQQAFLEQARILALTHHEKWDGTGYPGALSGEKIPLQGRLMAIADVYDALVSERPYKEAYTHERAVEIIKGESGSHFDPALVELFLIVADKFKNASTQNDVDSI
jgi:putative two-component system response regulator